MSSTVRYAKVAGWLLSVYCTGVLFRQHVVDWSLGSGPSMYPTFPTEKSVAIVSRYHKYGKGIRVGDIVHASHPNLVNVIVGKRVLGLPGDYVVYDADRSDTVGGAPTLLRPQGEDEKGRRAEPMMVQVPEGHVWLSGDNLGWSRDSRFYGPMPMAMIRGKIIAIRTTGWGLNLRWADSDLDMMPCAGTPEEQDQVDREISEKRSSLTYGIRRYLQSDGSKEFWKSHGKEGRLGI